MLDLLSGGPEFKSSTLPSAGLFLVAPSSTPQQGCVNSQLFTSVIVKHYWMAMEKSIANKYTDVRF